MHLMYSVDRMMATWYGVILLIVIVGTLVATVLYLLSGLFSKSGGQTRRSSADEDDLALQMTILNASTAANANMLAANHTTPS